MGERGKTGRYLYNYFERFEYGFGFFQDEYDRLKESFDATDSFDDLGPSLSSQKIVLFPQSGWEPPKRFFKITMQVLDASRSMAPGPPPMPVGAKTIEHIESAIIPKTPSTQVRILQRPKEEKSTFPQKVPACKYSFELTI